MFGKKETSTSFSAGSTTLVSKNTEIVGDINFSGNLMVEGAVKGNICAVDGTDAHARILDNGLVQGEMRVPTIVINGTISGDVYSSKHVELAAKAVVNGNVHYELIEMVKGAQVNGNLVYSAKPGPKKTVGSLDPKQDSFDSKLTRADVKTISSSVVNKA
ncbi:MAG: cytoskeletal protein CcmA (bactofilin family) [Cellvibrionaceae bacterium]|jgi:cytoskeletal protein CcmA (bactofilin family)